MSNSTKKNSKIKLQLLLDPFDYESLTVAAKLSNRSLAGQARQWLQEKINDSTFQIKKEQYYLQAAKREKELKEREQGNGKL